MVTIHRAHGYRFVIFANDHSPPHIHVFGNGGEARIVFDDASETRLDWFVGIGAGDLRRILLEAIRERSRMIAEWRKLHG